MKPGVMEQTTNLKTSEAKAENYRVQGQTGSRALLGYAVTLSQESHTERAKNTVFFTIYVISN